MRRPWSIRLTGLSIKWLCADLFDQDVSHKPDNWNKDKPTEGVKGADLLLANLDYVRAGGAFLAMAELSSASLKHALLYNANLAGVRLDGANLYGANLAGANLAGANLTGTDLDGVYINKANLNGTRLIGSRNMKPEQIKEAKNWQLAFYDDDFKQGKLHLRNEQIKSTLCVFLAKENPRLSDKDLGALYNQEVEKYQEHYGGGFVTPEDRPCKNSPAPALP